MSTAFLCISSTPMLTFPMLNLPPLGVNSPLSRRDSPVNVFYVCDGSTLTPLCFMDGMYVSAESGTGGS